MGAFVVDVLAKTGLLNCMFDHNRIWQYVY